MTFYNGKEDREEEILELKNAFRTEDGKRIDVEADIEVRVRMININYGRNRELMEACKPLFEYAWLIDRIREYGKIMDIEIAVDKALNDMSEEFEIKIFLIANKAEVKQMCLTEYNETETMEMFKEEGREEGLKKGREEGLKKGREEEKKNLAAGLIKLGKLTLEEIAVSTGLTIEAITSIEKNIRAAE